MNRAQFEMAYLDAFWERQRLHWENYADGTSHQLGRLDATLHRLFAHAPADLGGDRRGRVLRSVVDRGLVDHDPAVGSLRNRLDDWSNYRSVPATITPEWRAAIAADMEPDVLALVDARRRLAQRSGYASYGDLALADDDLDLARVVDFVARRRAELLPASAAIAADEHLSYESWFGGLDRLGGPDQFDAPAQGRRLAALLGLGRAAESITWVVRAQPIHGYAGVLGGSGDVRILMRPQAGVGGLSVAFHELGHALAHATNRGAGVFQTWTSTHDEAMACVVEHIGARLLLTPEHYARWELIERMETARLACSFLFEVDLQRDPARAREAFIRWYEPLVPVSDPVAWAVDSFRSIDPFRVQDYLIGDAVARATLAFLLDRFGDDHAAWGSWLVASFFADGRRRSLLDKVAALGDFYPDALATLSAG